MRMSTGTLQKQDIRIAGLPRQDILPPSPGMQLPIKPQVGYQGETQNSDKSHLKHAFQRCKVLNCTLAKIEKTGIKLSAQAGAF
jgi:hypothetical protein